MWIKDNITRTGKEVFYEAEMIERLKAECQEAMETYDKEQFYEDDCDIFEGEAIMANRIMTIIQNYAGER